MALPSGFTKIPGLKVGRKIGEGGMGEVYYARQLVPNREVAIKVLHVPPEGVLPEEAARIRREALLTASLSHPNIVTIHECGEVNGRFFLVMEYVAGRTLRERMRPGKPWPIGKAGRLLDAVATALAYIHGQGILHLDLKPENVLCGRDGAVKITDFGLALSCLPALMRVEQGLAQGTLDYAAPEQRHRLAIDVRTDLFSLATLAYELLTGRMPGRVFVPASERNPELPPALDDVLRRGLARDIDERQASVEAFRQELAGALSVKA